MTEETPRTKQIETLVLIVAVAALPLLVDAGVIDSQIAADLGTILSAVGAGLHLGNVELAIKGAVAARTGKTTPPVDTGGDTS